MLQTPSYHELTRRATILLGKLDNRGVLHSQCSRKRRVCLNYDIVLLAVLCNVGAGVEWMDFDLVHRRLDSGITRQQLINLQYPLAIILSRMI